ncbi:MSHA biogenesis protein MshI [Colwellia sp. RSH04]|nr:MSHA biogenesis protein MshI [Colwellia sp. RSH04]
MGIALRQNVISVCSIPPKDDDSNSGNVYFKEQAINDDDICSAIEGLQDQYNFSGQVYLVLNEQQAQVVQVDKPSLAEEEIKGALKWQVKDLVTIAPDNMVLDYYDAPMMMSGKEKINVVCAPLTELKKLVHTINEQELEVTRIITQEFAFANLVPVKNEATLIVCQQPDQEIVIIIVKQGQLYFHRRLRGFAQLASKTEEELSLGVIDSLSLEIQRSTDYFERQLKQAPIKEIQVLLPIELEGFFARKLSENTNVPVTLLPLPSPYHEQREFAVALGASLLDASELASGEIKASSEVQHAG